MKADDLLFVAAIGAAVYALVMVSRRAAPSAPRTYYAGDANGRVVGDGLVGAVAGGVITPAEGADFWA